MKPPTSPLGRALFIFAKKLIARKQPIRRPQVCAPDSFRDSMIELHSVWYATEAAWSDFLKTVRTRKQASIHDKLIDAAVTMIEVAASMYQGPLTYEASLQPENLQSLMKESICDGCGHQGDLIAILPHPTEPQWKLECGECGSIWLTGQKKQEASTVVEQSDQED